VSRLDVSSLSKLSATLRALPATLALRVAVKAAPVLSQFARESFDSNTDPYGVPWAPGVDGDTVSLRKTGALEKYVVYVPIGTKLRVALGVPYAKYQIGKRPVYPRGGLLPAKYSAALERVTRDEVQAALDEGGL
jgi:hypothetical protein